jgi:hypothetical protein
MPVLVAAWLDPATGPAWLESGEPEQQQEHDGTQDRADDADCPEVVGLDVVVLDEFPEESADEGSDDAEQDGTKQADTVPTGYQEARDQANHQADDDQYNDEFEHASQVPGNCWITHDQSCLGNRGGAARFGAGKARTLT